MLGVEDRGRKWGAGCGERDLMMESEETAKAKEKRDEKGFQFGVSCEGYALKRKGGGNFRALFFLTLLVESSEMISWN